MATSEQSYPDRYNRGMQLQAVIVGFSPVFNPADSNLTAASFANFLTDVNALNDAIDPAEATLTLLIQDRVTATAEVHEKARRIRDYVTSVVTWKKYHDTVIKAAGKVLGYAVPKKVIAPPTPPPATPPKKTGSGAKTQRAFDDVERFFKKLNEAVKKITGFIAPSPSGLSIAELEAQQTAYKDLNSAVNTADGALGDLQRDRKQAYDGENSLIEKVRAIKKAVSAQYGPNSTEAAAAKAIKN